MEEPRPAKRCSDVTTKRRVTLAKPPRTIATSAFAKPLPCAPASSAARRQLKNSNNISAQLENVVVFDRLWPACLVVAALIWRDDVVSTALLVVVSLAIPLLWITAFTDRSSFNEAIKLREIITEILLSLAEWENGKSTVFKILTLKSYPQNLVNSLRLVRGYMIVRLVVKLPRKRNVQTASAVLQQFYECVWTGAPGFHPKPNSWRARSKDC
jgi:hypothetical protein